ncbi:autophagy protein 3 [Reticulomyxa filosa]|uniref:Autophagy protein 3 n=1 Tax=Reticulomyxa filosa TaxID=46433 RepID=X6PB36_RETFI|nr:autophagy protein 3 [Reticulomyxa filosa]|eukprot:ETO34852.1 autophagy protein 3 [Reticulomyxa filosa]
MKSMTKEKIFFCSVIQEEKQRLFNDKTKKVAIMLEGMKKSLKTVNELDAGSPNKKETIVKKEIEEKQPDTILASIDEDYGNKVVTNDKTAKNQEKNENGNESDDSFEEIPDIESFDDTSNVVTHEKKKEDQKKIENTSSVAQNTKTPNNDTNENNNNSTENEKFFSVNEEEERIVKTRTYDMSITYDKFYRVCFFVPFFFSLPKKKNST